MSEYCPDCGYAMENHHVGCPCNRCGGSPCQCDTFMDDEPEANHVPGSNVVLMAVIPKATYAALLAVEQAAREHQGEECYNKAFDPDPRSFCARCVFGGVCAALARLDEARGGGR